MDIKNLMTRDPARCTLETSLHDVAQLMIDNDCGCIPVVENDESKTPIGMITDRDIVIRTVAHNKNPLNMIVGEVMTDKVISVTPDTTLEKACELMEKNHIRRLAVTNENNDLVGMLAQADIARSAPEHETAQLVKEVSESNLAMSA
ncbi:MAG: CBS domain-containing protein [Acidobacteriota bacterium]|nr:MAG: CBS domain-containing protein [Acidobacteriota bacterium]